jgi:oxygen-dependent protoporphyrinogen oxidase
MVGFQDDAVIRIAIVGGGISGLAAAYELELARRRGADVDWQLFEASGRLGGIVETTRRGTAAGEFILEGGPDGWVSEKPWARELATELGLESEIMHSNDATRKTYIALRAGAQPHAQLKLVPMADRMRMMVPEGVEALGALDDSPLFSAGAKAAYAAEPGRAAELRASAPNADESVASFVARHFGAEVLEKVGAPLLSGVFGGDVHRLSVRSVMPAFVAMEREHGSLIVAMDARRAERGDRPKQPIFTSLRRGMTSLVEAIVETLPAGRLHLREGIAAVAREAEGWIVTTAAARRCAFDRVLLACSVDAARDLLAGIDAEAAELLPTDASSAETAAEFTVPPGFGFLVPAVQISGGSPRAEPQLLAATFVDQKFPDRAPRGARVLRAFFGSGSAEYFRGATDEAIAAVALRQLQAILGPMPAPDASLTSVRRWPRSLPQYEVGHLDRMAQLDERVAAMDGLTLLGNSYRGVGVPDLIREARAAVRGLLW